MQVMERDNCEEDREVKPRKSCLDLQNMVLDSSLGLISPRLCFSALLEFAFSPLDIVFLSGNYIQFAFPASVS